MTKTAFGGDNNERPQQGCWCCGDRTVRGSVLHLEERPDGGVCFRCLDTLAKRKRRIERMTRARTSLVLSRPV